MKYILNVNSRVELELPAEERHQKLMAHLIGQKQFWGTAEDIPNVFPGLAKSLPRQPN